MDALRQRISDACRQAVPTGFFVVASARGGYAELERSVDLAALAAAASKARPRRRT